MRKVYQSDISREQFQMIQLLESAARKYTRPRTVDLYDVCRALPFEERLPMANVAQRLPEIAYRAPLFFHLESPT